MKCFFCLENEAIIDLNAEYDIIFLYDPDIHEKAMACENCHKEFKKNEGRLASKNGFQVEIPRK